MARHIGIAAASPEGGALCYRHVHRHASRLLEPAEHPVVSLHNAPLQKYIDAVRRSDWESVGSLLRSSAEALARAGAEICICPDNAVQHAQHLAEHNSPVPWVNMIDVVADVIERDGCQQIGLVGTSSVTRASSYQTRLGLRGVKVVAPTESEAEAMDSVIYGELVFGRILPESVVRFGEILKNYADRGCDGVVLACSEAPLIVRSDAAPITIYDTTDLLAERAVLQSMQAVG